MAQNGIRVKSKLIYYQFIESIKGKSVGRGELIEFMKNQFDWWDSLVA